MQATRTLLVPCSLILLICSPAFALDDVRLKICNYTPTPLTAVFYKNGATDDGVDNNTVERNIAAGKCVSRQGYNPGNRHYDVVTKIVAKKGQPLLILGADNPWGPESAYFMYSFCQANGWGTTDRYTPSEGGRRGKYSYGPLGIELYRDNDGDDVKKMNLDILDYNKEKLSQVSGKCASTTPENFYNS